MYKNEYKNIIRKVLYELISIVNRFVPKKDQICIYGGEVLNNNSEAMLRYLSNKEYKIICIADKHLSYCDTTNIEFIDSNNWNAIKSLMTSRVVLDSFLHTIKMKPTKKQLFINFWHGSPLKSLHKASNVLANSNYFTYIFYAAEIFKDPIKDLLQAPDEKMYLNGNLHSDYFFEKFKIPQTYRKSKYNIIWMPTYREGFGTKFTSKNIPIINSENISEIDEYLRKRDTTLFIKPHILQHNELRDLIIGIDCANIRIINEQDLINLNIPVYGFVSCMDALITDYSSVCFDFLLTGKQIGFAIDDYCEYSNSVGYAFENPMDYMPGKVMMNVNDLFEFIDDVINDNDKYKAERENVKVLSNYYVDGKNRERTYAIIQSYMRNCKV